MRNSKPVSILMNRINIITGRQRYGYAVRSCTQEKNTTNTNAIPRLNCRRTHTASNLISARVQSLESLTNSVGASRRCVEANSHKNLSDTSTHTNTYIDTPTLQLIDLFTTINQFSCLASSTIDGIDPIIKQFSAVLTDFKRKNRDFLDYNNESFDSDYIEFNFKITELESQLVVFINSSFANARKTEHKLSLLDQFRQVLKQENLQKLLDEKVCYHTNTPLEVTVF